MDYPIEFPKFIAALRALEHDPKPAEILTNAKAAWEALPFEVRLGLLEGLEIPNPDPAAVRVRLGKRPDAPRTLENILVILTIDAPEATGAAPASPAPQAAAAPLAPMPQLEPVPEPASAPPAPIPVFDAAEPQAPVASTEPDWAPAAPPSAAPWPPALASEAEPAETPETPAAPPVEHVHAHVARIAPAPQAAHAPAPAEPVHVARAEPAEATHADSVPLSEGPEALFFKGDVPKRDLGLESAPAQLLPEPEEAGPVKPIPRAPEATKEKGKWWSRFTLKPKLESDEPVDDSPVTVIPPIKEPSVREIEVYPVQPPFAYIRLTYNDAAHEYLYEVIEPQMTDRESKVLEFVENTLVDVIDVGLSSLDADGAEKTLRKQVDEILYDYSVSLNAKSKEKLLYYIIRDFLGNGKMEPVMRDEFIEDISCDGPQVPLFLYHRKYESVRSTVQFPSHVELDSFVIRMAQRSGKHISIAEPLLDATLPDGSRLNATLSDEVTSNGSTFTIRKFRPDPFTAPDLVRFGTMSADMLAYWWLAVQNGASAIYAGGTASGKTTSLNAILLFIPPQMKIVSIEDTREINLPHPNWIAGVTRSGFGPRDSHGRQAGEIDMFTLLKAALRQRPEYILVGEVRGQEAYALFQAMATGHTAFGTMHADSVESVIHRLESDPISIPRSLLESLDIVSIQIQTRIGEKRVRRTKEIVEIVGLDPHTRELLTNEVFTWNPARDEFEFSGVSYVLERIQMERNMSEREMREELTKRKEIIQWMIKKGMRDYKAVGKIVASYYKDQENTVNLARKELAEMAAAEAAAAAHAAAEAASEPASMQALDAEAILDTLIADDPIEPITSTAPAVEVAAPLGVPEAPRIPEAASAPEPAPALDAPTAVRIVPKSGSNKILPRNRGKPTAADAEDPFAEMRRAMGGDEEDDRDGA